MKKYKPFDLQAALNGAEFECKDGSQVIDWAYCGEFDINYPIIAFVKHTDGKVFRESYTSNGFIHMDSREHPLNLVMKPIKVTFWANMYVTSTYETKISGLFDTEDLAESYKIDCPEYNSTVPITVEL
jgi:hypothetical protein